MLTLTKIALPTSKILKKNGDRSRKKISAVVASVADSQDSSFPSQESESVTTQVRSYPSKIQQVATLQGNKSGPKTSWPEPAEPSNCFPATNPTRPRLTRPPTEPSCSGSPYS